jgi:hypothetical protein
MPISPYAEVLMQERWLASIPDAYRRKPARTLDGDRQISTPMGAIRDYSSGWPRIKGQTAPAAYPTDANERSRVADQ